MQIEVLLNNTPVSVKIETEENIKPKTQVVISHSGSLELGTIERETKNLELDLANFVRVATKDDILKNCENCKYTRTLLPEIKKIASDNGLDMKIGFISTNLDRSKLIVNYTSETRVDFRELIKILGAKYKTRIEMRQIGNRDESKMLGAIGMCGRVTCCKLYLSDFDKVSIKMAKNQNLTLNPTRINGMCGRLLCCLKYEDEYYSEMNKLMPRVGSIVKTPDGEGKVTSTDILRETIKVEFSNEDTTEIKTYTLSEITFKPNKK